MTGAELRRILVATGLVPSGIGAQRSQTVEGGVVYDVRVYNPNPNAFSVDHLQHVLPRNVSLTVENGGARRGIEPQDVLRGMSTELLIDVHGVPQEAPPTTPPRPRRVDARELRRRLHRLGLAVVSCGGATDEELRRRDLPAVCGTPPEVALWVILAVADVNDRGSSYVRTALDGMPANVVCDFPVGEGGTMSYVCGGVTSEFAANRIMSADDAAVRDMVRRGICACVDCAEPAAAGAAPAGPRPSVSGAPFRSFDDISSSLVGRCAVREHEELGGSWETEPHTPIERGTDSFRVVEMRKRDGAGVEWRRPDYAGGAWQLPAALTTRRWRPVDRPVATSPTTFVHRAASVPTQPPAAAPRRDLDDDDARNQAALPRISLGDLAEQLAELGVRASVLGVSRRAEVEGAFVVAMSTGMAAGSILRIPPARVPGNATLRFVDAATGRSVATIPGTGATLLHVADQPQRTVVAAPPPRFFAASGRSGADPTPPWLPAQVLRLGGRGARWEVDDDAVRIVVDRPFASSPGDEIEKEAFAYIVRHVQNDAGRRRVSVVVVEDPAPRVPVCFVRKVRDGGDLAVLQPDDLLHGDREEAFAWQAMPDPELSRRRRVAAEVILRYAQHLDDAGAAALATEHAGRQLEELPALLERLRTRVALVEVDDADRSSSAAARAARTSIAAAKNAPSAETIRKLREGLELKMKPRDKVVEEAGLKGDDASLLALERYADGLEDAEAAEMVAAATHRRRNVNPVHPPTPRRGGLRTPPERYEIKLSDLEADAAAWLQGRRKGLDVKPSDPTDPESARQLARYLDMRRRSDAAVAELQARAAAARPIEPAAPPERFDLLEPDEAADPAAVIAAQAAARERARRLAAASLPIAVKVSPTPPASRFALIEPDEAADAERAVAEQREAAERRRRLEAEMRSRPRPSPPEPPPPPPRPHPFLVDLSTATPLEAAFGSLRAAFDAFASAKPVVEIRRPS